MKINKEERVSLEDLLELNRTTIVLSKDGSGGAFADCDDFIDEIKKARELAKAQAGSGKNIYLDILSGEISSVPKPNFYDVSSLLDLAIVLFDESNGKELAFTIFSKVDSALVHCG